MNHWWDTVTDRIFLKKLYQDIGKLCNKPKILDIGVESYNNNCIDLFDNNSIQYWQLDPNKVVFNNNGFMLCKVEDAVSKYPEHKLTFDIILDIGVFGWNGIKLSSKIQDIYLNNIYELLQPNGFYILHSDRLKEGTSYAINFNKLYELFTLTTEFLWYQPITNITCHKTNTIWDIRFLQKKHK